MAALWRQAMDSVTGWLAPVWNPLACVPYTEWQEQYDADYPAHARALLNRLSIIQKKALRLGLQGDQRTPLKGHGLDFADLREYFPGDDIRKIDWNVYARTRQPHIKEYLEEKQLTAFLVVDLSPSMFLGRRRTKAQLALDLAGLLGLMLENASHRVGLAVLGGETLRFVSPQQRAGRRVHLQALLQQLLMAYDEAGSGQVAYPPGWLAGEFARLRALLPKRASVFVLSDFMSGDVDWEKQLGALSHQCELTTVYLQDPCDVSLPPAPLGLMTVCDPESRQHVLLDGCDPAARVTIERALMAHRSEIDACLSKMGEVMRAGTDEDPVTMLVRLLTGREGGR